MIILLLPKDEELSRKMSSVFAHGHEDVDVNIMNSGRMSI
jgi:hypothetical protein